MFYSQWQLRAPLDFHVSLRDAQEEAESGGELFVTQHYQGKPSSAAEQRSRTVDALQFHPPSSLLSKSAARPQRRRSRFDRYHVKTSEPLLPSCGLLYMELQLAQLQDLSAVEGDAPGVVLPPPIVLGVCRERLPASLLPGEERHSVGWFTPQRAVFSHGAEEGVRLHLSLRGPPPLTADGQPRPPSSSTVPRRSLAVGDGVGCLVNFAQATVSFTLNGYLLPLRVPLEASAPLTGYYFAVGVQRRTPGMTLRVRMLAGSVVGPAAGLPSAPVVEAAEAEVNTIFDLEAYSRVVAAHVVRKVDPATLTSHIAPGHGQDCDERRIAQLLRRHLVARGQVRTLAALEAELQQLLPAGAVPSAARREADLAYAQWVAHLRALVHTPHQAGALLRELEQHCVAQPEVLEALGRPPDDVSGLFAHRVDVLYTLRCLGVVDQVLDAAAVPAGSGAARLTPAEALAAFSAAVLQPTAKAPTCVVEPSTLRPAPPRAAQLALGQTLASLLTLTARWSAAAPAALQTLFDAARTQYQRSAWRALQHALEETNCDLLDSAAGGAPAEVDAATIRMLWRRVHGVGALRPSLHVVSEAFAVQLQRSLQAHGGPAVSRRATQEGEPEEEEEEGEEEAAAALETGSGKQAATVSEAEVARAAHVMQQIYIGMFSHLC